MPKDKPPKIESGAGHGVAVPGPISRQYKKPKTQQNTGTETCSAYEFQQLSGMAYSPHPVRIPALSKSGTR